MIYFLQIETGQIKIGHTYRLNERIGDLQTGNPYKLELIAALPGTKEQESKLHKLFRHSRCTGGKEWYEPHPCLVSFIQSIEK